jgi:hypothetical protein
MRAISSPFSHAFCIRMPALSLLNCAAAPSLKPCASRVVFKISMPIEVSVISSVFYACHARQCLAYPFGPHEKDGGCSNVKTVVADQALHEPTAATGRHKWLGGQWLLSTSRANISIRQALCGTSAQSRKAAQGRHYGSRTKSRHNRQRTVQISQDVGSEMRLTDTGASDCNSAKYRVGFKQLLPALVLLRFNRFTPPRCPIACVKSAHSAKDAVFELQAPPNFFKDWPNRL